MHESIDLFFLYSPAVLGNLANFCYIEIHKCMSVGMDMQRD